MRAHHQIVSVYHQIPHRSCRQIQLQRLPRIAIIERNVDGVFRPREKQSLPQRIFAHGIHRRIIGQSVGNFLPGPAAIVRAVDVSVQIVEPQTVDRRVRRIRIEMRAVQLRHLAPRRQFRRRHLRPVFSRVARQPDQTIVGACPDQIRVNRRRCQRINHSAMFAFRRIARDQPAQIRRNPRIVPRQIRADDLPAVRAIGRLEQHIGP